MPIVKVLIAALAFGLSAPLAKLLLDVVSPLFLAGLLYLGAGVFLGLVRLAWRRRPAVGRPLTARERWILAAVVLAGGVLPPPLLLLGLPRGPPAAPALLFHLAGGFTTIPARIVFGGHLGARGGDRPRDGPRSPELRHEPRPVHSGDARAGRRAHRRVLRDGAVLRRRRRPPPARRVADAGPPRGGGAHGAGDLAPGPRAPLARARARGDRARARARPRRAPPARARGRGRPGTPQSSASNGTAGARASAYARQPSRPRPPLRRYTRGRPIDGRTIKGCPCSPIASESSWRPSRRCPWPSSSPSPARRRRAATTWRGPARPRATTRLPS